MRSICLTILISILFTPLAKASGDDHLFYTYVNKWNSYKEGKNIDSSTYYTKKIGDFVKQKKTPETKAVYLRILGYNQLYASNFSKAESFFEEAYEIATQAQLPEHQIKAKIGTYRNYNLQQRYPTLLKHAYLALDIANQEGFKLMEVEILKDIANALRRQDEFKRGHKILDDAEEINKKITPFSAYHEAELLYTRGAIHFDQQEIDEAIYFFEKALKNYMDNNEEFAVMNTLSSLGQSYRLKHEKPYYTKAYEALEESLSIARQTNNVKLITQNLISLAEVDINLGLMNNALQKTLEAETLNKQVKHKLYDHYIANNKYLIFKQQGRFNESLAEYKKATTIRDTIESIQRAITVNELYAQYEFEKREKELLEKGQQLRKTRNATIVLAVSTAILLLTFFGVLRFLRLFRKNTRLMAEQKAMKHQQKITELESQAEMQAINAMLDGREKERQAIAETLHDSVSTLLSSANMHLQAVKHKMNGQTPSIIKTQKIIKEASEKVRFLSHELISSILIKFGLAAAVKDLTEKISTENLEFSAHISGFEERITSELENKIYHIIEELCNNILKHSKATKADITLIKQPANLLLEVTDNGIGFPVKLTEEITGIGLNKIRARVKGMNGSMHIESKPGSNSTITIQVPLHIEVSNI